MDEYKNETVLTAREYKVALQIQDASNVSGLAHSFSEVISLIWKEAHAIGKGTDWVNSHPITVLYADKIMSLTSGEDRYETFAKAYAKAQEAVVRLERDEVVDELQA